LESFNVEIDGGLLILVFNLFGLKFNRKSFDMTSLAPIVFNEAIQNNKTIYFIGTTPSLIVRSIKNIKSQFPKLKILGYRDGYMSESERSSVFNLICKLNIDYVICGMGTPLQEVFLLELKEHGWSGVGYTCGGFLHQSANSIEYYPNWINKLNLRSFYRMYDEPKLITRYFVDYPKAILIIIYDLIKYKVS
jgi:N-acetylglucosaminyldiphosphoundecaprenol N-acetyl-beta-D-mannosaminyltransferase